MTPGHTPGHLSVVVSSQGQRALLLGDAITCPVQLEEPSWQAIGDVDPALAARVRERLFRELFPLSERPGGSICTIHPLTIIRNGPTSR